MTAKTPKTGRMLRLLVPLKAWIEQVADENCSSLNAEVVRAIRERRERVEAAQRAAQ